MRITAEALSGLDPLKVHALYKLRIDVFVHEQRTPYAEIEDQDVHPDTTHLLAWSDQGELMGSARLHPVVLDGVPHMQFGRFVLTQTARGTGVGKQIFEEALRRCGDLPVYLTAQMGLVNYYRHFGFEPVGEPYEDTGVPHQPMRFAKY